MNRCRDCKHWYQPDAAHPAGGGFGWCGMGEHTHSLAHPVSFNGEAGMLGTHAMYGCPMFEPGEPAINFVPLPIRKQDQVPTDE